MSMLIGLFTRRADLTREQFQEYYETRHAPFNLEHFRQLFTGYSRSYVDTDHGVPASAPVDVVTRIEFADDAAMREMFTLSANTPGHQQAIADDEANFMHRSETHLLLTRDDLRTPMDGRRTAAPATITTLMKRRPGLTHAEFRDHYERRHVPLVAGHFRHLITSYTRSYVVQDYRNVGPGDRPVDVVSHIEFSSAAAMREMFAVLAAEPGIQADINADESLLMDRASTRTLLSTERTGFMAAGFAVTDTD